MVSIDRLKPHLGAGPFSAALPSARGRPPVSAPVVFQPEHPPAAATTGGRKSAKLIVQKIREISSPFLSVVLFLAGVRIYNKYSLYSSLLSVFHSIKKDIF